MKAIMPQKENPLKDIEKQNPAPPVLKTPQAPIS